MEEEPLRKRLRQDLTRNKIFMNGEEKEQTL